MDKILNEETKKHRENIHNLTLVRIEDTQGKPHYFITSLVDIAGSESAISKMCDKYGSDYFEMVLIIDAMTEENGFCLEVGE